MTLKDRLFNGFTSLSEPHKAEVIDFVELLVALEDDTIEEMMDNIINENLQALKELAK